MTKQVMLMASYTAHRQQMDVRKYLSSTYHTSKDKYLIGSLGRGTLRFIGREHPWLRSAMTPSQCQQRRNHTDITYSRLHPTVVHSHEDKSIYTYSTSGHPLDWEAAGLGTDQVAFEAVMDICSHKCFVHAHQRRDEHRGVEMTAYLPYQSVAISID